MKKNVAGQSIGVQMISATDGSAFTGATTIYITKDNGTQTIGSVSSGVCSHKGNGSHTYALAQAETNADHLAFTFIGTGAIPVTINVYPNFPQTVDNNVLVAAIKAKTDNLPSDPADQSLVIAATDALATLIGGLNNVSQAEVLTQMNTALDTVIPELTVAIPATTPTIRTAVMLLYMMARNQVVVQAGTLNIYDDVGTLIFSKALTDNGTTYTEAKADA